MTNTAKYSRQREMIKQNLSARTDHPTSEMIYADIRKEIPNISLGTVYRNLAFLVESGDVRIIGTKDGCKHFDWNSDPHAHFVCKGCGCVRDLHEIDVDKLIGETQNGFDGEISSCDLTFYGLCEDCKTNI